MIARLKQLLFVNRSTKQTIVKNVFWLSLSQVGSRLIRAAIIIYAARVLGAAEYGVFSYVLGLSSFFLIFADIGINNLLTRDVANDPEKENYYFASSFWLKTILLSITAMLVALAAPHFTTIKEAKFLIPLVAFLTVFDGIRDFSIAFLRGKEKMEMEAFLVLMMNVAIAAAGFAILNVSPTAKSLFLSYIISVGLAAILAILILWRKYAKIFNYFNKKLAYRTLHLCWPIAFSGMIGTFMLNTDIIMLGWWRTPEEIGYYSAGQRIIQILYTLPALLASGTFPTVSRFAKKDEKLKIKSLNEKLMTVIFLIAVPLAAGGIILAEPIFELVFGKEYLGGVASFRILLLTMFLVSPALIITNIILAYNIQRQTVIYSLFGSVGNVVFNSLLIPLYGISGAAAATFAAQLLNYGLAWRHIKKIDDFRTLRHLKKIIAAAIIMGIFTFGLNKLFNLNVIMNIIFSASIYFGALYLMKEKIIGEMKELFMKVKS